MKITRFKSILVLLSAAVLVGVACRSEDTTPSEAGLVWEAWAIVRDSYVQGGSLDSTQATGNMILGMLDTVEQPAYPFLTELTSSRGRMPEDVPEEISDVWKSWTLIIDKWPDAESDVLSEAAIQGLLKGLSDDTIAYLSPEEYQRAKELLEDTYQGIGAFVAILDGRVALSPMDDSPAEKAELKPGDVILGVEGEPIEGKSLQEVVDLVRGPVGSKVTLTIERLGDDEPFDVAVFRDEIGIDTVDRRLLPGGIGHITITDFKKQTPDEFLDGLEELKQIEMLALILDLRGNQGESIEAAQEIVSQFLTDGLFMYEVDKDDSRTEWPIEPDGIATTDLPIAVLIDALTGNVAEAVAGSLQEAERAEIIGTRTLGKGSLSVFKELSDGSAIYLPISLWYTPGGKLIQGNGVEPDIEVALTVQDIQQQIDSQLSEAYNYLDGLLPHFR